MGFRQLLTAALLVEAARATYVKYETVTGYFLQDTASTNASSFNYTTTNFGLINRKYDTDRGIEHLTQWQRFAHKIYTLNRDCEGNKEYKVLFMGRHGDGFHNDAEAYYGTPAWNCYWSLKDGNGTATWADAHLSELGISQALLANSFWAEEIEKEKIPTPQTFYTSPLHRCLETSNLTFSGLNLEDKFVPQIKELLRESITGHTCDRRSSKTDIHHEFPSYTFEKGFAEEDHLWKPLVGETSNDQDIRSKKALDQIFGSDRSTYISITSHSGEIRSILRVIKHREFPLNTGAVIPVLVKAVTVSGSPPATSTEPYTPISTCSTPPPLPTATS